MQLKQKKYGYILIANITFTVLLFCIIRLGKDNFLHRRLPILQTGQCLRTLSLRCYVVYFFSVWIFCSCTSLTFFVRVYIVILFIYLFIMFDIYVHKFIPMLGVSTLEDLHVQRGTDNQAYQSYESSNSFVNSLWSKINDQAPSK